MNATPSLAERIKGAVFGALVGDALGVPVEFTPREQRRRDPVTGMRGHGTWNQPAGTWSDDGALLLCTIESLLETQEDLEAGGQHFLRWRRDGHWAVRNKVFDVGNTTGAALARIAQGAPAGQAGGAEAADNGNGSLMRILPVALYFGPRPTAELAEQAMRWSAITHRHPRSQLACACYCTVVQRLLQGASPDEALRKAGEVLETLLALHPTERRHFKRVLDGGLAANAAEEIHSGGYVIDTLEASLWCLLQGGSFADIVLRAVNLGDDTDTTGCVTGGLAGAWLGMGHIPADWIQALATDPPLGRVIDRFTAKIAGAR